MNSPCPGVLVIEICHLAILGRRGGAEIEFDFGYFLRLWCGWEIGPDGKPLSVQSLNSGTFTTREEGDKAFTAKLPVEIETATKKNVQFAFTPGDNFQQGNYTVQIYQNGFLIGEGARELKKGGLFS